MIWNDQESVQMYGQVLFRFYLMLIDIDSNHTLRPQVGPAYLPLVTRVGEMNIFVKMPEMVQNHLDSSHQYKLIPSDAFCSMFILLSSWAPGTKQRANCGPMAQLSSISIRYNHRKTMPNMHHMSPRIRKLNSLCRFTYIYIL